MEQASNILSRALLSGMTMTNKECKICQAPLMKPRNSKIASCVVCEELKANQEEAEPEPAKIEESLEAESNSIKRSNDTQSNNSSEDHYAKKAKASELIGQKMLQGWTMLQEHCQNPNCIPIPLVRNKDLISICVLCNTQYLRETDFNTELHSNLNLINDKNSNDKKAEPKVTTKESKTIPAPIAKNITIEDVPKITSEHSLSITDSNISIKQELELTINQKLAELNQKLKSSQNLQEIQELLKCVELAISTLNSCKRN